MGYEDLGYLWKKVRKQILERDNYVCQIQGPTCTFQATEVDHIVPTEDGGPKYDHDNLRAACKPCNIRRANIQKAREGWRRSSSYIILVLGPPAAGKSTYINEHKSPGDLVIDYGAISDALGKVDHRDINAVRNFLLRRVRRGEVTAERVWIHSANPNIVDIVPHHEIVTLDPGRDVVVERCANQRPAELMPVAEKWYTEGASTGRRVW